MIGIADNAWQVYSLGGVFTLGFLIVLRVSQWLELPVRYGISFYVWHTLFCVVYILYSLTDPADAAYYFIESLHWTGGPMLGGRSVIFFNSILTQVFGFSYGGCFFVYNILGAIGLIAFATAMRDMLRGKSRTVRRLIFIVPFLPGFSFWSTAIGKDSIAFFGVGLICWAAAAPYRRFLVIALGFSAILAVRPHMAGILAISFSVAFLLASQSAAYIKLLLGAVVIPATIAAVTVSLNYVGLDEGLSTSNLEAYVDQRQSYNSDGSSSVDIANSSVPTRLFMYGFRPLFFDAGGLFGLVVSVENLVLLCISLWFLLGIAKRRSSLPSFQKTFFFLFTIASWLVLANTTANLGIAIRQKTMFTPMLLILMISYLPNVRSFRIEENNLPVVGPSRRPRGLGSISKSGHRNHVQ